MPSFHADDAMRCAAFAMPAEWQRGAITRPQVKRQDARRCLASAAAMRKDAKERRGAMLMMQR